MWPNSWITGEACGKAGISLVTGCSEYDDKLCYCADQGYLISVAKCISTNLMRTTLVDQAWERFSNTHCAPVNASVVDRNVFELLMHEAPFEISQDLYELAYRSKRNQLKQIDNSNILGCVLIIYWLLIFATVFVYNTAHKVIYKFFDRNVAMRRPSRVYRFLQKYVFIPAAWGERKMNIFRLGWFTFSMVSRLEAFIISGYILLCVIFMLTPYEFMDGDPYFDSKWKEMMRFASDRSGILGTINMPLFILFAMRNNFLIWITGWPYARFQVFHRAISRACYALLIVHSVTKHIFSASYGASLAKYFYPLMYYRYGTASMGLMALAIFGGSLRHKFYCFFKWSHAILITGGLICAIFHLKDIGWQEPIYVCFAIWAMDVIIRMGRILFINLNIFLPPIAGSRKLAFAKAKVVSGQYCCISLRLPIKWNFKPGQYIYLYVGKWQLLDSHPFSVVGNIESGLEIICRQREGMTKRLRDDLVKLGADKACPVTMPVYIEGPYGHHKPVSRYDEALIFAGGIGVTGVLGYVEEICITAVNENRYRNVQFIWVVQERAVFEVVAGRLAALQRFNFLKLSLYCRSKRSRLLTLFGSMAEDESETLSEKRESFASSCSDASSTIGTSCPPPNRLLDTRLQNAGLVDECSLVLGCPDNTPCSSKYEVTHSQAIGDKTLSPMDQLSRVIEEGPRPDINETVERFFGASQSSVCVAACGPGGMMDDVASAVSRHLDKVKYGRVEYFEEAFHW